MPGPADYTPLDKNLNRNDSNFKIGLSSRYSYSKADKLPGPGSYDILNTGTHSRHFKYGKFGTETREKHIANNSPGPGSYKIPWKIVEAPKYLVKSNEEFEYV